MSHHHHHDHECSCCCHKHHHVESCSQSSCCDNDSCDTDKCGDACHDFAKELIQMADCAWMELLKEKIKENIVNTAGNHLDQIAKTVAETNHMRWQNKMATQKDKQEFKNKLDELFNCNSCKR